MDSGTSSPTPSVWFDLASSCWRTWQPSLLDDRGSMLSSPTLPRSGSMRTGAVSEHPTSEPLTGGSGGSASPGLPTPRACDSKGRGYSDGLPAVVELLPTPTVSEATGPQPNTGRTGGRSLRETLLPTPRARDHKGRDPNPRGVDLNEAVALLPTTLTDAARQVASTGATTPPRSTGGPASSDGPHQLQLNPDETDAPA